MRIKNKSVLNAEEQIIIFVADVNGFANKGTVKKIFDYFNIRDEVEKYLQNYTKEEILGSIQSIILPNYEKIVICMYAQDICGKSNSISGGIDFEALEMCLLNVSRKCKAPIALSFRHGNYLTEKEEEKIINLCYKILEDKNDVTLYVGDKNE